MADVKFSDNLGGADDAAVRVLLQNATAEIRRLRAELAQAKAGGAVAEAAAEPIAVVGMACRFPGASSPDAYWDLLQAGVDAMGPIPAERWDVARYYHPDPEHEGTMYVREGGFIADADAFDPQFFGISPREAEVMDPQQRLLLELSQEAFENAGIAPASLRGGKAGTYVGICFDDYAQRNLRSGMPERIDANSALGNNRGIAAGRIAYVYDLRGPVVQLDTSCSSSLVAAHLACQGLRGGEIDLALAGGVNLMLTPETTIAFSRLRALSADGRCRSFDAKAAGYARGEGCGMLVLKRRADAIRDGDRVLALIRASAVNHDGASNGMTAPNGPAQTAVIQAALAAGRLLPGDVDFVEAHGTATPLGDPIEIRALAAAYGKRGLPLLVGAVKANIGHLEAAAGVAGLIKAVLSVNHGKIPPNPHFSEPNPRIPWHELPIRIPSTLENWPSSGRPRRAGVSGFGMSGTNAHLIVEQAPPQIPQAGAEPRPLVLLPVSAKSAAALGELLTGYRQLLAETGAPAAIAAAAQCRRDHYAYRKALLGADSKALIDCIDAALAAPPAARSHRQPRIAFLYSGQGAQYPNMGRRLYETEPVFRAGFDAVAALADPLLPAPLAGLVYPPVDDADAQAALASTVNTQPALFALQYALTLLWQSWGVRPVIVLGHSVGEYAAAAAAGIMALNDAVALICARARLMDRLPAGGAMAAVHAGPEQIGPLLSPGVEIAVYNGGDNTVLAGPAPALEPVLAALAARGVGVTPLPVSHAFHSQAVEPMLEAFGAYLARAKLSEPVCTFISSVHGNQAGAEVAAPRYWLEQIRRPVRFDQALATLQTLSCDICLEIGPRAVLTGFGRNADPGGQRLWLPSLRGPSAGAAGDYSSLLAALAALYEGGADPDWRAFNGGPAPHMPLPNYPFRRGRYWQALPAPAAGSGPDFAWPGRALNIGGERFWIWQVLLSDADAIRWRDHQVAGAALLPMAAYLLLVRAAFMAWKGAECRVTNFALRRGIWLNAGPVTLQVQLRAATSGHAVEIYVGEVCHAEGMLSSGDAGTAPNHSVAETVADSAGDAPVPAELYRRYAAFGIGYGEDFQRLRAIRRQGNAAHADIVPRLAGRASAMPHPAVVDAGLQLCGLLIETDGLRLPEAVADFEWRGAIEPTSVSARRRADSNGKAVFDLVWLSADGGIAGLLDGLVLAGGGDAMPQPADAGQWLYRTEWEPKALPAQMRLARPSRVAERLRGELERLLASPNFAAHLALQPQLEASAAALAAQALWGAGLAALAGQSPSEEALAAALAISADRRRYFKRILAILAAAGYLRAETGGGWHIDAERFAGVDFDSSRGNATATVEQQLLVRCGGHLAEILQARADPLRILFPNGDMSLLSALYEKSSGAVAIHGVLCRAVQELLAAAADGAVLRVLEIGAGTGATSAYLLPLLAASGSRVEYLFTDVSPHFLTAAAARFRDYPWVECALLDIETAPAGHRLGKFDLVVAANVLHATADLAQTLPHVTSLLAEHGRLLLLEATDKLYWLDLIFGTMPGWWRFSDYALRPDHPLLDQAAWQTVLAQAGLSDIQALQPASQSLAQTVILAGKAPAENVWLVIGETGYGDELAQALRRNGAAVERLAAAALPDRAIKGAVFALSPAASELPDRIMAWCEGIASAVGMLASQPGFSRLWLVLDHGGDQNELAVSALAGLVQTLHFEHPAWQCTLVAGASAEQLASELQAGSAENRVRYRGDCRYAARLHRYRQSAEFSGRLTVAADHTLAGLRWTAVARQAPAAGQIEIEVQASGLNFRDLLIALRQYPEAAELGAECAGVVVAVGEDVRDFAVGDRVMAITPAGLSEYVTLDWRLAARLPANCPATAEAAGLPVAFLTASHALLDRARLQAGEWVLIHAAAGGVGQAAIQIAQALGAGIIATASPQKHALLHDLGVRHVFSSRESGFAEAVRRLTGGRGADVVLNSLSGALQRESVAALGARGRFAEIGKAAGLDDAEFALLKPEARLIRIDIARLCVDDPQGIQAMLRRLRDQIEAGVWRPLPLTCYGRQETWQAFRAMQQGSHTGKLVITGNGPRFSADKTYLISGGLGALGLAVAGWMLERGAKRLCLLGRGGEIAGDDGRIGKWRAGGAVVDVRRADVTDRSALAAVFADIAAGRYPLGGIVHAAGVLDDAMLADMRPEQMRRVLAPKIAGGWHLHELSAELNLEFFVLFASAAGVLGSPGQANHAAANAFLDGLARYRRGLGLPGLSLAWGAWAEVGAARRYLRDGQVGGLAGIGALTTAQGLEALARLWNADAADIAVLPIDWRALAARAAFRDMPLLGGLLDRPADFDAPLEPGAAAGQAGPAILETLRDPDGRVRAEALAALLSAGVAATLGYADGAEIDRQSGFFELGMDSLTALELKNRLQNQLQLSLPSTLLFDYPSIAKLADYLAGQLGGVAPEAGGAEAARPAEPAADEADGASLADTLDRRLDALAGLIGDDNDDTHEHDRSI